MNLTLSWVNTLIGNGSQTLTYGTSPFDIWTGTCINAPSTGYANSILLKLFCSGATNISWQINSYPNSGCTGTVRGSTLNYSGGGSDFTCNPFHLHHLVTTGDSPPATDLISQGFTDFYIDGPAANPPTCCNVTFTALGCPSVGLPGAVVTATRSGVTIDSQTTDGSGSAILALVTNANVVLTATKSRWNTLTVNPFTPNCAPGANNLSMTVATGYQCLTGCADPIATTLHVTFSIAGAQTFTWSGSAWVASFTVGGHAYVVTLNTDQTMTMTRDGVSCGTPGFTIGSCPPTFSGTISVPAGTCGTELGSSGTITE